MTPFEREWSERQVEQLYQGVLQLSKNCFEIKKLCITVLASSLVLITTFSKDIQNVQLVSAHFIGAGIIILFFYLLDSQCYYYQEKLRSKIENIANSLFPKGDNSNDIILIIGLPVKERTGFFSKRVFHAFFNASMIFYAGLCAIDCIVGILFMLGYVG